MIDRNNKLTYKLISSIVLSLFIILFMTVVFLGGWSIAIKKQKYYSKPVQSTYISLKKAEGKTSSSDLNNFSTSLK